MAVTLQEKTTLVTNAVAIKDSIAAFNKGDLNGSIAPYAENVEATDPTGKYVGRDQLLASQKVWHTAFPDAKGDVTNQIAEGDQVFTEITYRGTHTGPLAGPNGMTVPATGKKIDMHIAVVDWFKNGKIQRERAYFDLAGLMQQLGVASKGP
ncbi:MAG TPA: ester cyclase [Candidatus Limnocylindria bacterium]|jgi:steroid delta-isomerase-like uncharacterized protein|nr:ester cyclase [Candidatus Limnocylindria bacterium]